MHDIAALVPSASTPSVWQTRMGLHCFGPGLGIGPHLPCTSLAGPKRPQDLRCQRVKQRAGMAWSWLVLVRTACPLLGGSSPLQVLAAMAWGPDACSAGAVLAAMAWGPCSAVAVLAIVQGRTSESGRSARTVAVRSCLPREPVRACPCFAPRS
jgi:hypothetical protein